MDEKGFEIKCLDCGSEDYSLVPEEDWAFDGEDEFLVIEGYYLKCNNCGNTQYL